MLFALNSVLADPLLFTSALSHMTTPPAPGSVSAAHSATERRRPWSAPTLTELPRLVNLTLQTGGGGGTIVGPPITGTGDTSTGGFSF